MRLPNRSVDLCQRRINFSHFASQTGTILHRNSRETHTKKYRNLINTQVEKFGRRRTTHTEICSRRVAAIMLLGVYRGVAHDKMAFAYSPVGYCDNLVGSFQRCRDLERPVGSGLGRATKLQPMGRLQLRGSEGFAEGAQGYGAQWQLRSLPRL